MAVQRIGLRGAQLGERRVGLARQKEVPQTFPGGQLGIALDNVVGALSVTHEGNGEAFRTRAHEQRVRQRERQSLSDSRHLMPE